MSKIPIKSRIPLEAWTVALLVTLFSIITSTFGAAPDAGTSTVQAKLMSAGDPVVTSAIR